VGYRAGDELHLDEGDGTRWTLRTRDGREVAAAQPGVSGALNPAERGAKLTAKPTDTPELVVPPPTPHAFHCRPAKAAEQTQRVEP
jgi:hypothetical protein